MLEASIIKKLNIKKRANNLRLISLRKRSTQRNWRNNSQSNLQNDEVRMNTKIPITLSYDFHVTSAPSLHMPRCRSGQQKQIFPTDWIYYSKIQWPNFPDRKSFVSLQFSNTRIQTLQFRWIISTVSEYFSTYYLPTYLMGILGNQASHPAKGFKVVILDLWWEYRSSAFCCRA